MALDLFISYSHLDNLNAIVGMQRWVSTLHDLLSIKLAEYLGRQVTIWRDNKMHGNDKFGDEILNKLFQTELLLAILSPAYINSEWCLKELDMFWKKKDLTAGISIDRKSRLFKVIKTPFECPKLHELKYLHDMVGYLFYRYEDERLIEFRPDAKSEYFQEYLQKVFDLARDISLFIESLDESSCKVKRDRNRTIYFAETSSDLLKEHDSLRREMSDRGFHILPDRSLPLFVQDGNYAIVSKLLMRKSCLSIHLIGNTRGVIPENEKKSIIELQCDIAGELCIRNRLKRIVWMPTIDLNKERLYDKLIDKALSQGNTELIKKGIEEFKTIIFDLLDREDEDNIHIWTPFKIDKLYLFCGPQDSNSTILKYIYNYFHEKGMKISMPNYKSAQNIFLKNHQKNLSDCQIIFIFFDKENEDWLEYTLSILRKTKKKENDFGKQIGSIIIFITGNHTDYKEKFRSQDAKVFKEFSLKSFDVFDKIHNLIKNSKN